MNEKLMQCDSRIEKFPPLYEVMPCPFCGADREYIVAEENIAREPDDYCSRGIYR